MQAVSTAQAALDPSSAPERVAIVASDELMVLRVEEALRVANVFVSERATAVEELPDRAADSVAILLSGGTTAASRKALVQAAARRFPEQPLVMIASPSPGGVHKALEAGAAGFVLDSQLEATLACTIRAVASGQVAVPRDMRGQATRPALSHREREALALVVKGYTNRQIAQRLFLAESTVKTHLTSIFSKLGVGSRSEAVALVLDPETKLGIGVLALLQENGTAAGASGARQ